MLRGGVDLAAAAEALGLIPAEPPDADLAIVDVRDPAAVAGGSALPPELPRVVVVGETQLELVGALGLARRSVARSCDPAVLGPLVAANVPAVRRRATRSVLITSVRGGVGRSLLAANLARRLAPTRSTLAVDITGGGVLSWWLGTTASSWSDLESLADELTAEHLRVVATEISPGLRVIGGPPSAPSRRLAVRSLCAALELAEIVLVDAPILADRRTRELIGATDRVLVLSYEDPASVAALAAADVPDDAWVIASQSGATSLAGRDVFRAFPRGDAAIASAAARPSVVGGALGSAYDDLAELIAIDST